MNWILETDLKIEDSSLDKASSAFETVMARQDLGFKNPDRVKEAIHVCLQNKEVYKHFKKIVVIGFGGSSLGTKALSYALFPEEADTKLIFLDNVDSMTIDQFLLSQTDFKDLGWLLCSKSGSTIEVLSIYEYLYSAIQERHGLSIIKNTMVITESRSNPLFDFAKKNQLLCLDVPLDIGGRFSVLTSVGLFPLGFLGLDFEKAFHGFNQGLKNKELIIKLSALLFESLKREENNFYSFMYSDRLFYWSLWLQQLWSESLSKKVTRSKQKAPINSTFVPCRGASDQHSVLQQVMQGREKKIVGFHRLEAAEKGNFKIKESLFNDALMLGKPIGSLLKAEVFGTQKAISEEGISTFSMVHNELNEISLVSLMTTWMMTTAVLGELMDIDAFNQPGVESGKRIARRVLSDSD